MDTIVSATPDVVPQLPVFAITGNAWDRLPDEPTMWYNRFDKYYRPMSSRSLLGAYNLYQRVEHGVESRNGGASASWSIIMQRWDWQRRALAYDDHLRNISRQEEEHARKLNRQERIRVATQLLKVGEHSLDCVDMEKVTISQSSAAIKTAISELRIDHHDVPATQHNVDVRAILAVLPVELRAVVAQTLKDKG